MLAKTRLRYFIQPILVRWSNLYLGIPPLIKMSSAIKDTNFSATIIELKEMVLTDPNTEEYKSANKLYIQSIENCSL